MPSLASAIAVLLSKANVTTASDFAAWLIKAPNAIANIMGTPAFQAEAEAIEALEAANVAAEVEGLRGELDAARAAAAAEQDQAAALSSRAAAEVEAALAEAKSARAEAEAARAEAEAARAETEAVISEARATARAAAQVPADHITAVSSARLRQWWTRQWQWFVLQNLLPCMSGRPG